MSSLHDSVVVLARPAATSRLRSTVVGGSWSSTPVVADGERSSPGGLPSRGCGIRWMSRWIEFACRRSKGERMVLSAFHIATR